ncbi:MAG: cell-cycle regulation histidine triad protein [Rhodocyclaceae bacterium]|nr:MAG: cell-cycle regulation histidine triad protein [Rhodocyclaceae bacterium]TND03070.1 MAG: cell-cycle regulation histidine triad protein [Rhodocyclaceae bacterium]
MALLDVAKKDVDAEFKPNGYNIGINDGAAAGQTVPHLHVHLIPRYTGDRSDPRGGIRWVFPERAKYWP